MVRFANGSGRVSEECSWEIPSVNEGGKSTSLIATSVNGSTSCSFLTPVRSSGQADRGLGRGVSDGSGRCRVAGILGVNTVGRNIHSLDFGSSLNGTRVPGVFIWGTED